MKNIFFSFCVLSFFLSGCASVLGLQKPTAELNHVFVKDLNFSGATLVFVVDVENPNNRELKVDDLSYEVFLSGKEFAKASTGKEISVPALSKSQIEVPLPVTFANLAGSVGEILQSRQLSYRIQGDAKLNFFKIPFSKEGKVDLRGE